MCFISNHSNQSTVLLLKMFTSLIFVLALLSLSFATVSAENIASSPRYQDSNNCLPPPHPEHGRYIVNNNPSATPGERYSIIKLDLSCDIGYLNNNNIKTIFCLYGAWSGPMPTCVRDMLGSCTLSTDDLKVEYRCLSFPGTLEKSWECDSVVHSGTIVRPICRYPAYFSFNLLPEMHCKDGIWDYNPICKPACGLTTKHLKLEGTSTNHLELPWYVSIYSELLGDYQVRCGGSLITATKIISAAACFHKNYNDELRPASDFLVTVNKMYRSFNDTRDRNRQLSEVTDIKVPSSYRGLATKYVDDIAIVVVKTPFFFHLSVRPVCLDFDHNLDRTQLTEGNTGKAVRWIWSTPDGQFNELNVIDISYLKIQDCEYMLPDDRRPLLTKDKFCAIYNGMWNDDTSTGSGLAFLESTTQRYYLQGVASGYYTANSTWIIKYTSIAKHEDFIKEHL